MKYILNIGLETSKKMGGDGSFLEVKEVLDTLKRHRLKINSFKVGNSRTEPTLIVSCDAPFITHWESISGALLQEAIAVYDVETLQGQLVGKYAELWGEFNPAFFLL